MPHTFSSPDTLSHLEQICGLPKAPSAWRPIFLCLLLLSFSIDTRAFDEQSAALLMRINYGMSFQSSVGTVHTRLLESHFRLGVACRTMPVISNELIHQLTIFFPLFAGVSTCLYCTQHIHFHNTYIHTSFI